MIEHFDGALTTFESDVREGKANVKVVSNHGKPTSGGGSFSWLSVLLLLPLMLLRLRANAPAPDFLRVRRAAFSPPPSPPAASPHQPAPAAVQAHA